MTDVLVSKIRLDAQNPRLPEVMLNRSEEDIIRYMHQQMNLEELARSMLENGYFRSEPLTVMRDGPKSYIVLEGNRRIATLRLLLGINVPDDIDILGEVDPEDLKKLKKVPCHIVEDRDEVESLIGFRHIGGLKKWSAEAKARFILSRVQRLVDQGENDPFKELGRRVGSNSQGMRNPYIAIRILHHARDELGVPGVNALLNEHRFGVWLRALNSRDIRDHIGFGNVTSYRAVEAELQKLKPRKLKRVISDFVSVDGEKAVLTDSRQITIYGRILQHTKAEKLLRNTGDFELASQVANRAELPQRIQKLVVQAKLLKDEVEGLQKIDDDLFGVIHDLHRVARLMKSAAEVVSQ